MPDGHRHANASPKVAPFAGSPHARWINSVALAVALNHGPLVDVSVKISEVCARADRGGFP